MKSIKQPFCSLARMPGPAPHPLVRLLVSITEAKLLNSNSADIKPQGFETLVTALPATADEVTAPPPPADYTGTGDPRFAPSQVPGTNSDKEKIDLMQIISYMPAFKDKSPDELRVEDYALGLERPLGIGAPADAPAGTTLTGAPGVSKAKAIDGETKFGALTKATLYMRKEEVAYGDPLTATISNVTTSAELYTAVADFLGQSVTPQMFELREAGINGQQKSSKAVVFERDDKRPRAFEHHMLLFVDWEAPSALDAMAQQWCNFHISAADR